LPTKQIDLQESTSLEQTNEVQKQQKKKKNKKRSTENKIRNEEMKKEKEKCLLWMQQKRDGLIELLGLLLNNRSDQRPTFNHILSQSYLDDLDDTSSTSFSSPFSVPLHPSDLSQTSTNHVASQHLDLNHDSKAITPTSQQTKLFPEPSPSFLVRSLLFSRVKAPPLKLNSSASTSSSSTSSSSPTHQQQKKKYKKPLGRSSSMTPNSLPGASFSQSRSSESLGGNKNNNSYADVVKGWKGKKKK